MFDNINLTFIAGHGCDDWVPEVTSEERTQKILSQVHDGSIILVHDFAGNTNTVEAMDMLIPALKAQGYEFVTISELFRRKGITPQRNKIYTNVLE